MPSHFQKQSQLRKLIYTGAIIALFTLTLLWRQVVEAQSAALDLHEQNLGEAELTGSVIRLTLTGSRGVAICGLWWMWQEKSKRQEWNDLELLTAAITKLQPHFRTPWFFHAWHLAYNVSVECDRVRDKYFYISRGIQLVAEGERQNRDNPDMRFEVGYILHDKLGSSDEQNTLRCLFQLSCIPPADREPRKLMAAEGGVDLDKFQRFCEAHPFLVRRLREYLGCKTPQDVLDFLAENRDVPTRYEAGPAGRLKPPAAQFPVLPRRADGATGIEFTAEDTALPDDFDNYQAARTWMLYSQQPLPPPNPVTGDTDYDRAKYRMPRRMAPIIFRGYPAVMQTRLAERLQKEGWFDERGWIVDEGRQGPGRWFPKRRAVIGGNRNWSGETWTKARDSWTEYGERTGLYFAPAVLADKEKLAQKYRDAYEVAPHEFGPEPRLADQTEEMQASFQTHRQLFRHAADRRTTNFAHFHAQASGECQPEAIAARRRFFQARRKAADPSEAIRLYEQGFADWKKVLDGNADFRRDLDVQEDTYQIQYDYLWLVKDQRGHLLKQLLLAQDLLGQAAARPALTPLWLPPPHLIRASLLPPPLVGPLDGNAPDGQPYFSAEAIRRAHARPAFTEKTGKQR